MTGYKPALKARESEYVALAHAAGGRPLLPLIELVPHAGTGNPRGVMSETLFSLEHP